MPPKARNQGNVNPRLEVIDAFGAKRRFFYGPGMDNYDIALLKNVRLTESTSLQFRLEDFNIFNHAQFFGPQSVDGNIGSSSFGQVVSADSPHLVQLGAKFFH